ncbi:MAG: amino acid permease [Bryobacteraceae bacterium]
MQSPRCRRKRGILAATSCWGRSIPGGDWSAICPTGLCSSTGGTARIGLSRRRHGLCACRWSCRWPVLFQVLNLTLIVATVGSGAGAVLAGARLLLGMGRDNALPSRFFGYVDPVKGIPSRNVVLIGVLAFAGAQLMTYQLGAELLNFGAFIGFMGVNLSAFLRYWWRGEDRSWSHLAVPVAGFLICAYMWWSLRESSKLAGSLWLGVGLIYGAWKTKGFRRDLVRFD